MQISFSQDQSNVDRENGILKNVLLMRSGIAKGHGVEIDLKTLQGFEIGKSVKAFINHKSIQSPTEVVGYFYGVSIHNKSELRADFKFLDSYKKHHEAAYDTLMELAEKEPELLGISLSTDGLLVWKWEDQEIPVEMDKEGKYLNQPHSELIPTWRITKIKSADFVDRPAATDKLFDTPSLNSNMAEDQNTEVEEVETSEQTEEVNLEDKIATLEATIESLVARIVALETVETVEKEEEDFSELTNKIAQLELKFSELGSGKNLDLGEPETVKQETYEEQLAKCKNFSEKMALYRKYFH